MAGTTAAPGTTLGARVGPLPGWQVATLVDAWDESPTARTLVLEVPTWPGHLAGQHVDLRLTAADGYRAERSYSMAGPAILRDDVAGGRSAADPAPRIQITVQRVPDGEVSTYLCDTFEVGYPVELRGPVGGWFVWEPDPPGARPGPPVLLLAGGSGIVPLVAMLRERRRAGSRTPFRMICSVRSPEDRLYVDEISRASTDGAEVEVLYTRSAPLDDLDDSGLLLPGAVRARRDPGRITVADVAAHGWPAELAPACFVCGPTGFVEAVARMLLALGHDPASIRTERFGPAGD